MGLDKELPEAACQNEAGFSWEAVLKVDQTTERLAHEDHIKKIMLSHILGVSQPCQHDTMEHGIVRYSYRQPA